MTVSAKAIGATAGSLVLLSSGMLAAAPVVAGAMPQAEAVSVAPAQAGEACVVPDGVRTVEGQFSYDQGVVTPTETIFSTFVKAAATLCQSASSEEAAAIAQAVQVYCPSGVGFEATVQDMAGEEGVQSYLIGCSCASNGAGGGAIVNADVSGVSLASVAAMVAAAAAAA